MLKENASTNDGTYKLWAHYSISTLLLCELKNTTHGNATSRIFVVVALRGGGRNCLDILKTLKKLHGKHQLLPLSIM